MANHPHQVSTPNTVRSIGGRIYGQLRSAVDGTIVGVRHDSDTECVIGAHFDIQINGVTIFADPSDETAMADGDFSCEQNDFDIAINKGDSITFRARTDGSFGRVGGKLYSTLYVEDGLPTYFGGTSSTSFAIGSGSKAFATQENLAYTVGSRVRIASSASPTTNYMEGVVTAYSAGTLTVNVSLAVGSGTHTDWLFSLAGEVGATGATGAAGATGATGAAGVGVPSGGTTGQVLTKIDGTNYNTNWQTPSGGGGGASELDDLTDVDTTTTAPASGDVLEFNGSLWIPKPRKSVVVYDDFSGGSINGAIWDTGTAGAGVSQTGGKMEISSNNTQSIRTVNYYNMWDKQVTVKLDTVISVASNKVTQWAMTSDNFAGAYYALFDNYGTSGNNKLRCQIGGGGGAGDIASSQAITFSIGTHVYIRMRVFQGVLTYQYSTDGVTFYTIASIRADFTYWAGMSAMQFFLQHYNTSGGTEVSRFDSFLIEDLSNAI